MGNIGVIARRAGLVAILFVMLSPAAFADCTSPAATAGALQWVTAFSQVRFCNGTSWVALNNTTTATGCSVTGAVQYVSGEIMWCNGSVWVKSAPSTDHGACAAAQAGYFYYSGSDTYYWFCNGANWRRMGP